MTSDNQTPKRKLIEVALPLEAINRESGREKAIRHGHPSTVHLWWSRKPLATARAVLFAQLVDDPSSHPDRFPDEDSQRLERERLHQLINDLALWNAAPEVLGKARTEILRSTSGERVTLVDPFAGGGSIPLEASRLGLKVQAYDINPVATLINKAVLTVPHRFGEQPTSPGLADSEIRTWPGYSGLSADILAYGRKLLEDITPTVGVLYPEVHLDTHTQGTVIAWLWCRAIICPNPACGIEMPIVSKWWLGKKKGKEAYLAPRVAESPSGRRIEFDIRCDPGPPPAEPTSLGRQGARCLACGNTATLAHIKTEARRGNITSRLMAVAVEGARRRHYLPATPEWEAAANVSRPAESPEVPLSTHSQYMGAPQYGMSTVSDLFTPRQLHVMTSLAAAVTKVKDKVLQDQRNNNQPEDPAYAEAIATYLGLAVSRYANYCNSLCRWRPDPGKEQSGDMFSMQAIQIVWDYSEANPWSNSAGGWMPALKFISKAVERLPKTGLAEVKQLDAAEVDYSNAVISTDPPYFDYVPYSDLSDFFYAWLRSALKPYHPDLFSTIATPKSAELVADRERKGTPEDAREFFQSGFRNIFAKMYQEANAAYPMTVYYAFRESSSNLSAFTGWETILQSLVDTGWSITATWPMRSELANRSRSIDSNALASSIVLALRKRPHDAAVVDLRTFTATLRNELPTALHTLQEGHIAPVDLPQACIGPGMAVFSRYRQVLEDDGSPMSVGSALTRINEVLDAVLNEQEGDFDSTSRFAIAWYRRYGYGAGKFGDADALARARNTSVDVLARDEVLSSRAGNVQLLSPSDLSSEYNVLADSHTSNWEALHHLINRLENEGIAAAGELLRTALSRPDSAIDADLVKELAHLLFRIAESNGRTNDALSFNTLVTTWPEISDAARTDTPAASSQSAFDFDEGDD